MLSQNEIELYRLNLSHKIAKQLNYQVQYGPFKGMKLLPDPFWGEADLAVKILGLYEKELLELLCDIAKSPKITTLVDLGAADGYYPIGGLLSQLFDQVVLFEKSLLGQQSIKRHLTLNHIEHSVCLYAQADQSTFLDFLDRHHGHLHQMVFLIDIEGFEYDLMTPKILNLLRRSHVIIEVHNAYTQDKFEPPIRLDPRDFKESKSQLESWVLKTHCLKKFYQGGRDLSEFEFLHHLPDNDRALLISEGRDYIGCWWHLIPK